MPYKDPAKRRAYQKKYQKKYYQKNKDVVLERQHDYYQDNKEERDAKTNEYLEEHPWIRHYSAAKQRCENPKHPSYKYYGGRGIKFCLTVKEVKTLYIRDRADLLEKPSLDRENSKEDYTFNNCRFIENVENAKLARKKGRSR